MNEKLDPFILAATKRAYLYDSVLLRWELSKHVKRTEKYNRNKVLAVCGIHVVSVDTADQLSEIEREAIPPEFSNSGYLFFFNTSSKGISAGYSCLMKRLRDTVAHGHYSSESRGQITVRHAFDGKTRIFGRLGIDKLIELIEFINSSDEMLAHG